MTIHALPLLDDLLSKDTDDCILWPARPKSNGYGQIQIDRKKYSAHRFVYERVHGRLAPGLLVRHTCDVKLCVNPRHLIPGTRRDNTNDALERGQIKPHESCNKGHPFTEESTYTPPNGQRTCRICKADRMREWQRANPEKSRANTARYRERKLNSHNL